MNQDPSTSLRALHGAGLIFPMEGKNSLQDHQVGPSQPKCVPQPGVTHQEINGEAQVPRKDKPDCNKENSLLTSKGPPGTSPVPLGSLRKGLDAGRVCQGW